MIVVYGATGYTGRLIAHRLAQGTDPFVVSGRSDERLRRLVDDLRREFPDVSVQRRTADVADPRSLCAAFEGASALVSCAGPFERVGEPVVEAAMAVGVAYCDITGEASFMRRLMTRWSDAPAPVVPACGFDFIPHSLAAALAAGAVGTPESIHTALLVRNFGTSAGTRLSAALQLGHDGLAVVGGRLVPASTGSHRRQFRFPAPTGEVDAVSYPGGDVLQVHRHFPAASEVRTYFVVPSRAAAMVPVLAGVAGGAFRLGVTQRVLERLAASGAEGPSYDARQRTTFAVLSEASGGGRAATAATAGFDVYGSTAVYAVEVARRLGHWRDMDVGPGFRAPAEVVGDVGDFADACGLEYGVQQL